MKQLTHLSLILMHIYLQCLSWVLGYKLYNEGHVWGTGHGGSGLGCRRVSTGQWGSCLGIGQSVKVRFGVQVNHRRSCLGYRIAGKVSGGHI